MIKYLLKYSYVLMAIVLTGCLSGGGGSVGATGSSSSGIFVDTNVAGLSYRTSSGITGVTDADGRYNFKAGDTVTFSLGGIEIGSCKASNYVTPMSIFPGDMEAALNLAQFLQSVDSDGDPSNGITPSQTAVEKLEKVAGFDFKNPDFDNLLQTKLPEGLSFVSDGDAMRHMEESFAQLKIKSDGTPNISKQNIRLFVGGDDEHGFELWKYEDEKYTFVKELLGGTFSSSLEGIVKVGDKIFFSANDGVHGEELWMSDGTKDGTKMVKDINSNTGRNSSSTPSYITPMGNKVIFRAYTETYGDELWISDGTEAGTKMLRDIRSGDASSSISYITAVDDKIFFRANDGIHGSELWISDGTIDGTKMVKDIENATSSSYPQNLVKFNDKIVFMANSSAYGQELWISDGTEAGTHIIKDIASGSESSYPREMVVDGNQIYFIAGMDFVTGYKLYKSDGTEAGTVAVKSFSSSPSDMTILNHKLYFSANDDENIDGTYGTELWVSDGTEAGTKMLKDIRSGDSSSSISYITAVGDKIFFRANDGIHGSELWVSDGTKDGTKMVKDIIQNSSSSYPYKFTVFGDKILFTADDRVHGRELWISDGTESGTKMIKNISQNSRSSYPNYITVFGDKIFFRADDRVHGRELWISDGTEAGTYLFKDINKKPTASLEFETYFYRVGDKYFFLDNKRALWVSDGTEEGTIKLPYQDIDLKRSVVYKDTLIFTLYKENENGEGLIYIKKSDGTIDGTTTIFSAKDVDEDSLVVVNDNLYFISDDTLYISDGTEAGTKKFVDSDGSNMDNIVKLKAVGDKLYFLKDDNSEDSLRIYLGGSSKLYKTDGTANGTVLVVEENSTIQDIRYLTDVNGTLFFSAYSNLHGRELWKSDGTTQGTVMVKNIALDTPESDEDEEQIRSSNPRYITDVNGIAFFVADDIVHGRELWKSDGTESGTTLVKDVVEGSKDSYINIVAKVDNKLYFQTRSGVKKSSSLFVTYSDINLTQEVDLGISEGYYYRMYGVDDESYTVHSYDGYLLLWIRIYKNDDDKMILKKIIGSSSETVQSLNNISLFEEK